MEKRSISSKPTCDVLVIGGGPAGMMAANRAAERGLSVIILEKNDNLGKKLLITGGGRCNVTNAEFDTRVLLSKYKDAKDYLFSPFSKFGVQDMLDYLHSRGLYTKIENEKRVFPVTDKAQSVWDVLVRDLKKNKVTIYSKTEVTGFVVHDKMIAGVNTREKGVIFARACILATGGTSHPETGSTGDGFTWLTQLGHTVTEPDSSLVPIKLKTKPDNVVETRTVKNIVSPLMSWFKDLQGISLQNIRISVYENTTRKFYKDGKVLFTHLGITGPTILNMSKEIGELVKYSPTTVHLDLFPKLNHKDIDTNLIHTLSIQNTKKIKNAFGQTREDILSTQPRAIFPIILMLSGINPEKTCSTITKEERKRLAHTLKDLVLHVEGLLGAHKAIVTSGGIPLNEINWKNMSSKKYANLHIVGDVLDIDRPSGGYSLQLCWTTGYVAGDTVLE